MNRCAPLRLVAILGLSFGLVACATPEQKPAASQTAASQTSVWRLAADSETHTDVLLNRGMSQDEVLMLLGPRRRVFKNKKADEARETWLYRREVDYERNVSVPGATSADLKARGGFIAVAHFVDIVHVEFVAGLLQSVDVERRREQMSPGALRER